VERTKANVFASRRSRWCFGFSVSRTGWSGVVLVVEDEVLLRLMVADELRRNGLSVVEAANADRH
jgi:hypothetical protein